MVEDIMGFVGKLKRPMNGSFVIALIKDNSHNEDFIIRGTNLVKYIGDDTEVVIPNGVTNIVNSVFDGCKKI